MKAAAFKRHNEMGIVEVAKPKAGPGEVVLKVHDCGICGSDLHACQYGMGLRPDSIMGHEFCGEVHEIGSGRDRLKEGQRVAGLPFISCGTCDRCQRGMQIHCHNLKGLGLGQLPGAYAEFVCCSSGSLFKLPDNVSSRDGALVEPLSVGLHAVKRPERRTGRDRDHDGRGSDWTGDAHLGEGQGRDGGGFGDRRGPCRTCAQARRRLRGESEQSDPVRHGARTNRPRSGAGLRMHRDQGDA